MTVDLGSAPADEPPRPSIVLCEDDADIRELLATLLSGEGWRVRTAADGAALDRLLGEAPADLVVLDWMLPGEDGLSICARLHARGGPPVLMLTARDEDGDRVAGLDTGADAYLTKPFNPNVLLAHVRAALRRSGPAGPPAGRLCVGDLEIDVAARRVAVAGREVAVTTGEFDLLLCLAAGAQRVLSREDLMRRTRGRALGVFDRTIDVQVSRLRAKLEAAGSGTAHLIRAVRNAGYILSAPVERG